MGRSAVFNVLLIMTTSIIFFILTPDHGISSEGSNDVDEGLVLHYSFEDWNGEDDHIDDISGHGRNGMIAGDPQITRNSVFGSGIRFDLDGDGIEVKHNLNLTGSFAMSFWIFPEGEHELQYMNIIDDGYAVSGIFHRLLLGDDSGLKEGALLTQYYGNFISSERIIWDNWNHIVYEFDQISGSQAYYINGKSAGITSGSSVNCRFDRSEFRIGFGYDARYNFGGIMDEIRIYNTSLGMEGVSAHFMEGMHVVNRVDLEVRAEDIAFSDPYAKEGDEVSISAWIRNNAIIDLHNISVYFMAGDAIISDSILIKTIRANSIEKIDTTWLVKAGKWDISVIVDGENSITEMNEENNLISIDVYFTYDELPEIDMEFTRDSVALKSENGVKYEATAYLQVTADFSSSPDIDSVTVEIYGTKDIGAEMPNNITITRSDPDRMVYVNISRYYSASVDLKFILEVWGILVVERYNAREPIIGDTILVEIDPWFDFVVDELNMNLSVKKGERTQDHLLKLKNQGNSDELFLIEIENGLGLMKDGIVVELDRYAAVLPGFIHVTDISISIYAMEDCEPGDYTLRIKVISQGARDMEADHFYESIELNITVEEGKDEGSAIPAHVYLIPVSAFFFLLSITFIILFIWTRFKIPKHLVNEDDSSTDTGNGIDLEKNEIVADSGDRGTDR
ncbi:MAG: LamG-like jellyroll fold domain-containing protein [Thermoplasmatota archaeon]